MLAENDEKNATHGANAFLKCDNRALCGSAIVIIVHWLWKEHGVLEKSKNKRKVWS